MSGVLFPQAQADVPFDAGNTLLPDLAEVSQAVLTTVKTGTARGDRMVFTLRTPTTTVTLVLDKTTAEAWARQIGSTAARMAQGGLVTGV